MPLLFQCLTEVTNEGKEGVTFLLQDTVTEVSPMKVVGCISATMDATTCTCNIHKLAQEVVII